MGKYEIVEYETPLTGDFDPEALYKRYALDRTVKGMFFGRHMAVVGEGWKALALHAPPRLGRYIPFADYPALDYSRLTVAAAKRLYPQVSLRQALRLHERGAVQDFAESVLGRVIVASVSDPGKALVRVNDVFRELSNNGTMMCQRVDDNTVRMECRDLHSFLDSANIGSTEQIIRMFGKTPKMEVSLLGDFDADYLITW